MKWALWAPRDYDWIWIGSGLLRMDSQGGFSRWTLKGDSQGGFSRGILKDGFSKDGFSIAGGLPAGNRESIL